MHNNWTLEELKRYFTFTAEDQNTSDPDILYRGELIDVERGGIRSYEEEKPKTATKFTELSLPPPTLYPSDIKTLRPKP
ncbi:hypothetical protein HZC35_03935 [Candidatus Saganbacteria bacterium]|nr:hypothetical protein [Candidatus Saganbacteria bacterium]